MTTACGECTSTVITVSENLNNVQRNTTSTATIAAVNQCGYYLYYHHSYMCSTVF